MAKHNERTAEATYQERVNDVGALLDLIAQEIKMHTQYAKKEGLHWGHVGDINAMRCSLMDALAQLAQQDLAFIESHLAEMRKAPKTYRAVNGDGKATRVTIPE